MISGLKPYPKMKDSGVAWLGQVPEHWKVLPNRALFTEVREREHPNEEMLSVTITKGVIRQKALLEDSSKKDSSNLDKSAYKLVQPGDIAYNKMRAWQGALGRSSFKGIISPAYVVQRPREGVDSRYFHYLMRTPAFVKEAERWSYGIVSDMWSLRPEHFRLIYASLPPVSEQASIVRFLNYVDAPIQHYVRNRQALIKVVTERKQAAIHHAVTRGYKENCELKASGLGWLGSIPSHWELRRLKTITLKVEQGVSPQAENCLAEGNSWGVLKSGCVNHGIFREREHKKLPDSYVVDESLAVKPGDVLVSRACGSPHLVGSVGRVEDLRFKLILSDKTFRPIFSSSVDPDFMVLAMNSRYYRHQVEQAISGAEGLANNLPLSSLRAFYFPIPPLGEQREIVARVGRFVTSIDNLIAKVETEIALIREFRTRLISDLVTGKWDVQAIVKSLPAEAPSTMTESLGEASDDEGEVYDDVVASEEVET
jgi:type I restriction enzyme S subunit